jgi:hypothetical protein
MIYFINIFVIYILNLLTLSLFSNLRIFGVVPLIPLFFIISLAYFRKGVEPLLLAAFSGIYLDLFSSYPFGFYLSLFLFAVIVVRYMFQEGMRSLSFWYYFIVCSVTLSVYYLAQIGFLWFEKVKIGVNFIVPVFAGIAVNLICVILIYALANWYFDKITVLADNLKRR